VSQAALLVMAHDATIAQACAAGSLELNPFLPLVAHCLLESLDLLTGAARILCRLCVEGISANEERCQAHVDASTAVVTALVARLGYEAACAIARKASERRGSIRDVVLADGILTEAEFSELTTPEAVFRLGSPDRGGQP
jgi:aspartate ammonia-lyase